LIYHIYLGGNLKRILIADDVNTPRVGMFVCLWNCW